MYKTEVYLLKGGQSGAQKYLVNFLVLLAVPHTAVISSPQLHRVQKLAQFIEEMTRSTCSATLGQFLCVLLQLRDLCILNRRETVDVNGILAQSSRELLVCL